MVLITLVLVIEGCVVSEAQMYEGERLKPDAQATLESRDDNLVIVRVDGQYAAFTPGVRRVYLRPGKRTVLMRYTTASGKASAESLQWFVGAPGQRYTARSQVVGYSVRIWIEEEGTGHRVGQTTNYEPPAP